MAVFTKAGYEAVAPAIIQPAGVFLDVIGETLRARTYVFTDPDGDELCLRPDLTVPICRLHLERHPAGNVKAKYCYNGTAFRFQPEGADKAHPREFRQAGIEAFAATDREKAEAQTVATIIDGAEGRRPHRFPPAHRRSRPAARADESRRHAGALAPAPAASLLAARGVSRRTEAPDDRAGGAAQELARRADGRHRSRQSSRRRRRRSRAISRRPASTSSACAAWPKSPPICAGSRPMPSPSRCRRQRRADRELSRQSTRPGPRRRCAPQGHDARFEARHLGGARHLSQAPAAPGRRRRRRRSRGFLRRVRAHARILHRLRVRDRVAGAWASTVRSPAAAATTA